MILLNKADLADERQNRAWMEYFKEKGIYAVSIDSRNKGSMKAVSAAITEACKERQRETGDEESKTVRYVRWLQESLMLENQHLSIPLQEKPVPRPVINQELQKENSGYV